MATLDPVIQKLLNDFADSQIALRYPNLPFGSSNIQLGDLLAAAALTAGKSQTMDTTYDFAKNGGAIGTLDLGMAVPAGAIITRFWTDSLTVLASAGAATVALAVGTDSIMAATAYNNASLVGTDEHTSGLPLKTAAGGDLKFTIAAAALTAGKLRVIVSWLNP